MDLRSSELTGSNLVVIVVTVLVGLGVVLVTALELGSVETSCSQRMPANPMGQKQVKPPLDVLLLPELSWSSSALSSRQRPPCRQGHAYWVVVVVN